MTSPSKNINNTMSIANTARQAAVVVRARELLDIIAKDTQEKRALNGVVTRIAYAADKAGMVVEGYELADLTQEELLDVSVLLRASANKTAYPDVFAFQTSLDLQEGIID